MATSLSWGKGRSSLVHRAYLAAIAVKGIDGVLELLAGFLIAVAGTRQVYWDVIALTAPEFARDPDDRVVHIVRHGASSLAHASSTFVVAWLLVHGLLKTGIVINLWRGAAWIFPVAAAILGTFIVYMSYRLIAHCSGWLLGFALFDVLTLVLVLNEWRNRRAA